MKFINTFTNSTKIYKNLSNSIKIILKNPINIIKNSNPIHPYCLIERNSFTSRLINLTRNGIEALLVGIAEPCDQSLSFSLYESPFRVSAYLGGSDLSHHFKFSFPLKFFEIGSRYVKSFFFFFFFFFVFFPLQSLIWSLGKTSEKMRRLGICSFHFRFLVFWLQEKLRIPV